MHLRQAPAWRGGQIVEDASGTASASGVDHPTPVIILDRRNLFPCSIIATDGKPPIASILIELAPGVFRGASAMNDEKVVAASKSLFGAWEGYRFARDNVYDIASPGSQN
jgi:hypothetical protein